MATPTVRDIEIWKNQPNADLQVIAAYREEIEAKCAASLDAEQAMTAQLTEWWHGATETHVQLRKLYDEQNAELQKIIAGLLSPENEPKGFIRRCLAMSMEDRDYILSVSAMAMAEKARADRAAELVRAWAHYFGVKASDTPSDVMRLDTLRTETIRFAMNNDLIDASKIFPIYLADMAERKEAEG